MQNNENLENKAKDMYAGFFVRFFAYVLDMVILALVLMMPNLVIFFIGLANSDVFFLKPILFHFSLWDIVQYLLMTAYFVLFTYFSGSTLGKKALSIKVVGSKGEKLSFLNVLYRETIGKYLSALILNLGYLLIFADKEKRGLHDIMADTNVIYTCKFKVYQEVKYYQTPVQPIAPAMQPPVAPVQPQQFQPLNPPIYPVPEQTKNNQTIIKE